MKKKLLALSLSLAMAFSLAACGGNGGTANSDTPSGGDSEGGLISVGIINNDPNESGYRTANVDDMKRVFCEENGYDAQFYYSLKNDEQIAAAKQMIQDEVDYLLISAAGTSGWDTVLQDAQDAGIQVILYDRTIEADDSLYVAAVIYAENDDMAKGAVAALDASGITHGKDGDVIVMGFDCNKWALEEVLAGRWNYDGQCNPFQADTINEIIQGLENGEEPAEKMIYLEEKGFDAATITQEDVDTYGI